MNKNHAYWKPILTETGNSSGGFHEMTCETFRCSSCGHEIDVSEGYLKECPKCKSEMQEEKRKQNEVQ